MTKHPGGQGLVDLSTAAQLLDFGARLNSEPRAREQLQGAVAIHNLLHTHGVAYLADEVGMGKTYVALGAIALFRHFNPNFRILIIAPRENIQDKWRKELQNFVAHNVRFPDFRNRSITNEPVRPGVGCRNLLHFAHEAAVNPHRDFFVRLSSFSLGISDRDDRASWRALRDEVTTIVPWLDASALSMRGSKEAFKDNLARAICCALPKFDLVVVDEGHNLKHGFRAGVAARNRVLALAFGHPSERQGQREFRGYGPRARRVLFLSATPLEESYHQLWNQLDIFGLGGAFAELKDPGVGEDRKKELAGQFLVRRVTAITMAGEVHTKNQYRREWRKGGVEVHDQPQHVTDPRQRLIVALVQKKVAELLGSKRFNMSFQVGMLASFESFLETAKLKRDTIDAESSFDDLDQTDDQLEREGIDVHDLNRLARDHRNRFGREMPHPKMDALVESLSRTWREGRKALVFVRRVASVKEIKRKLDDSYDGWLLALLRDRLPLEVQDRFGRVVKEYQALRLEAGDRRESSMPEGPNEARSRQVKEDRGGLDTFYAWFFRGEGPTGVVSGANIQRRFTQAGSTYATFFEDNHVAVILGVPPGGVAARLAAHLSLTVDELKRRLRHEAAKYLSQAKRAPRAARIEAFQAAALELLMAEEGPAADAARLAWHQRFEGSKQARPSVAPPELGSELEFRSFLTELRQDAWSELRQALWPEPTQPDALVRFRESHLRAQLMASTTRLGHALIDMYLLTINRLRSLELRTLDREAAEDDSTAPQAVTAFLEHLERQRLTPLEERDWGAFDELEAVAKNFDLILDVNFPDARNTALPEVARHLGSVLGRQQPTAGMSGQINRTVVQQFRMPGYPFVLVTTDLLQEGEDLHTFCSSVYHYGISWTPSAMEQRIGRIDRVRSQSDRHLNGRNQLPPGEELLQVYYPYLADTVEVLQVNRVLQRMNTFLRLMHEGLGGAGKEDSRIQVDRELARGLSAVEAITGRLVTAFPVQARALEGTTRPLEVKPELVQLALQRFRALPKSVVSQHQVAWEKQAQDTHLLGSVSMPSGRIQPFALLLGSDGESLIIRCISPVGRIEGADWSGEIRDLAADQRALVGVAPTTIEEQYNLTLEDDVLLAAVGHDGVRVGLLVDRVTGSADAVEAEWFPDHDHQLLEFERGLRNEGASGGH